MWAAWLSAHTFLCNSQPLDKFVQTFLVLILLLFKLDRKLENCGKKFHLYLSVKYRFHSNDCHESYQGTGKSLA